MTALTRFRRQFGPTNQSHHTQYGRAFFDGGKGGDKSQFGSFSDASHTSSGSSGATRDATVSRSSEL